MDDMEEIGPASPQRADDGAAPHQGQFNDDIMEDLEAMIQTHNVRRGSMAGSETFGPARRDDTGTGTEENNTTDVDTCRICRGEGTNDEPLFYPCKCSGSIKYVHQNCLMEWLSHSQKKHCELCKTPFRFTKLYAANMPGALPFHVFISHLAKYLFDNLLVWLRALLVLSVWFGWLPYLMHSVWSCLFWISDEGLGGGTIGHAPENITTSNSTVAASLVALSNTPWVCPSSPLFATTTIPATVSAVMDRILKVPGTQLAKTLLAVNATKGNSYSAFLRLIFGKTSTAWPGTAQNASSVITKAAGQGIQNSHASLLSQVAFLRTLTRSPSVNRVLIAILEGQLITVSVVVSFILVILVRDYVVQQQPEINMRAAFNGENGQAPQPPRALFLDVNAEDVENLPGPHTDDEDEDWQDEDEHEHNEPETQSNPGPPTEPQANLHAPSTTDHATEGQAQRDLGGIRPHGEPYRADVPSMLVDAAAEGYNSVDSGPSVNAAGESAALATFRAIHEAADGDVDFILQNIREQALEDDLDKWVQSMDTMKHERMAQPAEYRTPVLAESSTEDGPEDINGASTSTADKGKGKADNHDDDEGDEDASLLTGNPLRPRANTDGPQINTAIHPLANNSWSFADLTPDEDLSPEQPEDMAAATMDLGGLQPTDSGLPLPTPSVSSMRTEAGPSSADEASSTTHAGSDWLALPEMEPAPTNDEPVQLDIARPLNIQRPPVPAGLVNRVAHFMFQDVDAIDPAELLPLDVDDGHEDPLPALAEQAVAGNGEVVLDPAVFDDAQAAFDMDAIDDAEDLDGILELLGMRGPIAGLFQNFIFCAFVVSVAIVAGVLIPYNLGRITVWCVANPMRSIRMLLSIVKFLQDLAVFCVGAVAGGVSTIFMGWWQLFKIGRVPPFMDKTIAASWNMTMGAGRRIARDFLAENPVKSFISASEVRTFSAISHGSLLTLKSYVSSTVCAVAEIATAISGGSSSWNNTDVPALVSNMGSLALTNIKALPQVLSDPNSWVINLGLPEPAVVVDPELTYWSYGDRAWAVLAGYLSLSVAAALYLRRGAPFSTGAAGQEFEASLIDILKQASGVTKVIMIIGIEMLAFPFYCGLLLDVALLPLFEDATLKSRLLFTLNNPYTSCFVHWFVGTGYMFHFALFVSMCRKIMRKGVLYFIRDPDDPEFHPVRDVLERTVTIQLRKILFSAFVYGALVMVCLGGVVWGLAYFVPGVLPIHYSSNEPVLEFPIDLLFYNFLMPLAVKFFKPGDGLHAMYTWWFRKCARVLRITWFLFGERMVDEEGTLALSEDSPDNSQPWWRKALLEVDEQNIVVPKTWKDTFKGGTAKPTSIIAVDDMIIMNVKKKNLVETKQIHSDGRFVRVPASDQVKIPKDKPVFLQVSERNTRLDGKPDLPETDLYSTNQYQLVYVPPWFQVRIFLFILFIWIFAAVTGVGITIVPLVFGRHMFKLVIPAQIRTNDIYAFSIGVYVLGSLAYTVLHARSIYLKAKSWLAAVAHTVPGRDAIRQALRVVLTGCRLLYAYFFILAVFPFMVVSLFELYLLIPMHTYMYGAVFSNSAVSTVEVNTGSALAAISIADINPKHTIRVIQAWTIGLLYLHLASRFITHYFGHSRLSAAVRAVLRRGWLDPDLVILTRVFVVPGLAIWASLVTIPLLVGRLLIAYGVAEQVLVVMAELLGSSPITPANTDPASLTETVMVTIPEDVDQQLADAVVVLIYRMSYPITQMILSSLTASYFMLTIYKEWRIRIRDEAYLIGERLHNFGVGNGHARARDALRT